MKSCNMNTLDLNRTTCRLEHADLVLQQDRDVQFINDKELKMLTTSMKLSVK